MFKNSNQKKCSINTEIDQSDKQVDRIDRLIAECHLVDRVWFCIEWTREDSLPKKNIFQSIFQKVHKNYPSVGWSRIFFGASCDGWPQATWADAAKTLQARNLGRARGEKPPLENFSTTWKNVLDIVQKIWAPLSKLFAPPGVPSWLRAWGITICFSIIAWQSWFRRNRHFAFCVCITY